MDLELPCVIRGLEGKQFCFNGFTANISRAGALVRCRVPRRAGRLPDVDEIVDVDVALPRAPATSRRCFHGRAKVVRVESDGAEVEIAVCFERLQFRFWHPVSTDGVSEVRLPEDVLM